MKIAISGFLDGIPKSQDSHYRGWMELCKQAVEFLNPGAQVDVLTGPEGFQQWREYQKILVHHGLYYYGDEYSLNLFGGMTPDKAKRFEMILSALNEVYPDRVYSLEYSWPIDVWKSIHGRLESKAIEAPHLRALIGQFNLGIFKKLDLWSEMSKSCDRIVMGDSHCGAAKGKEPAVLFRNDRETLFGACRRGFKAKIEERFPGYKPKRGTFLYGNIDIRHHLCRQPDPFVAARSLARSYADQISLLGLEEVEIVTPYLIENESRPMSKSVYFKDTPFFGSWQQRDEVRAVFAEALHKEANRDNMWKVIEWHEEFMNDKGELPFSVMEKPQSIHLSPKFYRDPLFVKKEEGLEDFFS